MSEACPAWWAGKGQVSKPVTCHVISMSSWQLTTMYSWVFLWSEMSYLLRLFHAFGGSTTMVSIDCCTYIDERQLKWHFLKNASFTQLVSLFAYCFTHKCSLSGLVSTPSPARSRPTRRGFRSWLSHFYKTIFSNSGNSLIKIRITTENYFQAFLKYS